MSLILGDQRLDDRQFEDLVPQWFGILATQSLATFAALAGHQRYDLVAIFSRHQRPSYSFVPWLSTSFFASARLAWFISLLAILLVWFSFSMRMYRTRRHRRVSRCQLRLICLSHQHINPLLIIIDELTKVFTGLWRELLENMLRNNGMALAHAHYIDKPLTRLVTAEAEENREKSPLKSLNYCHDLLPARERLR